MKAPLQARNDSNAAQTDTATTAAQKRVLADDRPEAVAQRKLAEMMNNSPRVLQQRARSDAILNSPRMMAQRHEMNALFGGMVKPQGDGATPAEASLAQREEKTNNTGLPNQLKSGIESLSGVSMDHVTVHYNSDKPAQLQAHAYAQGNEIHLGAGQERHLPHEAWHVAQQRQGRVSPTVQMQGVAVNDNPSLEREADVMGARAMQMCRIPGASAPRSMGAHVGPVQLLSFVNYLTGNLSEDEKDGSYFRRSSYNPLNALSQRNNVAFEHGNTAYHSTSVHGAHNTLDNMRARHQPGVGMGAGMSQMVDHVNVPAHPIRRQNNSSRFASASWEKHVRKDAHAAFVTAAAGFTVRWQQHPLPFGAPGAVNTSKFNLSYTNAMLGNYEVGVTSTGAVGGPPVAAQTTHVAMVTINYEQVGAHAILAWIGQLYPVPALVPVHNTGPVAAPNVTPKAWSLGDLNPFS